ncbi:Protein NRT1/ PTR FAMILY 5.2 [Hibiscus syriacus]|uniref:Protein NRT1/ PTR FAMILY 5.2 n=1 Tax=Hibiscus syriacus TaxID=106335 RepID=A0A6A2XKI0_HIBSY|nr:Protein NRT1/ PTR FAMILY 5.2 [Hibiscus syriacus]
MSKLEEERGSVEEYTEDGSVDLKGRPVLRSNTGRWKACSFIVGYEVFERMAYYGIASNLVLYLTKKLHEGTVTSANNVNNWVGIVWMTPILGAYIADAHLGRYWTFVIASAIYGISLLTLAVSVPALRPPSCGTGGTKPNISTMGTDQFDDFWPKERVQKLSFFNRWMFSIFFGTLFSNTFLIYIQDHAGWGLGYGLPTAGLMISILVFLVGTPYYRHKMSLGTFTRILQVLVAAVSKFLDKAAVKSGSNSPWMLCPVTQVEETKRMAKMIPLLIATFIPSTMLAQVATLFVKQATTLDLTMGPHFKIPPACLTAFVTILMLISITIYDRLFVPTVRLYTKNPRGITLLQRMGIGLVPQITVMIIACFVERKRISVARENHKLDKDDIVPLSIFILLPQFALMGVTDSFAEVAKIEFFYDQQPPGIEKPWDLLFHYQLRSWTFPWQFYFDRGF